MLVLLPALLLYALGMVLTGVGSRLAGRCATWCCALCGLPLWVVGGTVAAFCLVLPQLVFAFLAAGLSLTALAVGTSLAGAVADLGLVLALCLLRRDAAFMRREFCVKCALLLAACLVLVVFVRDGVLSYTGIGLLMALFVLFVLQSIAFQYYYSHESDRSNSLLQSTSVSGIETDSSSAYTAGSMQFPAMSIRRSLQNLAGVVCGFVLLVGGAGALLYSVAALANMTGTIQALWAATLLSFGFCLPLLAEVLHHPFGSVWKRFALRCRFYPPDTLPMQMLNSAILNLTLVLPICSLMYRRRLPVGAQFRAYDVPVCIVLALVLLLPPLLKKKVYRWQGTACLLLYLTYLAAVLVAPLSGA